MEDNVPQNVLQNVPQTHVGERSLEEKLIVLIKNNSHISQREMAAAIGKTTKTVERIIKSSKRIKRSGPDRGGHWEIVEKKKNN